MVCGHFNSEILSQSLCRSWLVFGPLRWTCSRWNALAFLYLRLERCGSHVSIYDTAFCLSVDESGYNSSVKEAATALLIQFIDMILVQYCGSVPSLACCFDDSRGRGCVPHRTSTSPSWGIATPFNATASRLAPGYSTERLGSRRPDVLSFKASAHAIPHTHSRTNGHPEKSLLGSGIEGWNGLTPPTIITFCFPSRGLGALAYARRVDPRSSYSGLAGHSANIGGGG